MPGIQSVSAYVRDVDRTLDFYVSKLGFEQHVDAPLDSSSGLRWVTVAPPGSATEIVLVKGYAEWPPERVGKFAGIVYNVQDIRGTFADLKARGVDITEGPVKQPWGMQGQFKDQDGNSFVVMG